MRYLGLVSLALGVVVTGAVLMRRDGETSVALAQGANPPAATGGKTGVREQHPIESPGPGSRRTALAITEIMYKPAARADRRNLEFVEIYNSNPWFHDISGHRLDGEIKFTFPTNTIIPGHGFVVVAAAPADIKAQYGLSNVFGPFTGTLKTSGPLRLYDEIGGLILAVDYNNDAPWPMGASGAGHSIVLARPSYGEGDPRAWQISEAVGGSPGAHETPRLSPLRNVVVNEILANTDAPDLDAIELYNHSNEAVDLSGCVLTDDPATNKFVMPAKTSIAPRGFLHFTETQLGFKLDAAGETILFKDAQGSRVLDALRFRAQENGVAFGRYPDGANEWHRLAKRTFGASNASPLISDVGINEIMYHPLSRQAEDTYVELFNRGSAAVNLSGWKFVDGIEFTFPTNTVIPPNGYLVVAANIAQLLKNHPHLNPSNMVGNFTGKLSGKGERLALSKPVSLVSADAQGRVTTNVADVVVDEVTYSSGGRWGEWADGGGSSLELIDARADKRLAANWADSDETAKAKWTTIEATGTLDHGHSVIGQIAFAQIGLLEAGECLVDDIEVLRGTGGANHVANPAFDQGMSNWTLLGNHSRSTLAANSGYPSGGNALHLRASSGLRPGANSATVALNTPVSEGQTATLRFKARWLKGWPEAMLRLNGNWLEAAGRLPVPANLGTPGLPNSRAVTNAAPAIHGVTHTPSLPAANEAVVVTAHISDPDGVNAITLRYRIDPSRTFTDARMSDDGTGGDTVAGDGIFSATIPGQAARRLVAFTVVATDSRGAKSRFPELLNSNAPDRECLVMFSDTHSSRNFGTYHLWVTQANVERWIKLPTLSNEEIDATLVSGSRVIYNAGARYTGSPYHQAYDSPVGTACNYTWRVPRDDKFLGYSSLNTIHWPGNDLQDDTATQNNNDPTIQREQVANTFLRALGLPWVNRRYVYVYVNGQRRGTLMEDALRPSVSLHDMYFPNDKGGQIYKFQPFYEFAPLPSGNQTPFGRGSWLVFKPYLTTGGAHKKERYRWHFELRDTPDSLSNYTNLIELMNAGSAVNRPDFAERMERVADMDNWMRLVAANQAVGNWDVWGGMSGQNIYGYVSPQKRWTMFMYDMGIALGNRIAMGPGVGLMSASADNQMWRQIYTTPKFRRTYWRAMKELLNSAMLPDKSNPLMESKYKVFAAEGLNVQSPASIASWIAQARPRITALLARDDAPAFTLAQTSAAAANGTVTLSGIAPVEVTKITVNGQPIEPTWRSVKDWTLQAPVPAGAKTLTVAAMDRFGNAVGRARDVTVSNP